MPPLLRSRASDEEAEETTEVEEVVEVAEDLDVVKELAANGTYYIWSQISARSLVQIHQDITLKHLSGWDPKEMLQIIINSEGGDLSETYALIDLMGMVPTPISTIGFGTCASAGAMLLASGTKGLRMVAPSTAIMIHSYSWGASGKHKDLVAHRKIQNDSYDTMVAFWIANSRHKTKKAVEKYLLRSEDVWLTAKEALAHGIVDHVGKVQFPAKPAE